MKLELGVFDECLDYESDPKSLEPVYDSSGKCWSITGVKNKVREIKVRPEKPVTCPIFPISYSDGSSDNKANREKFKEEVEITLLKEIERIYKTIGKDIDLDKLVIPIKKPLMFETNKRGELSCHIELGIMVFE